MNSAVDISATAYDFPPDLAAWRQRFFDLDNESINISEAEYASYMPYVDNVWSRKEQKKNTEYFRCRRWRKELDKPRARVGARAKLSRDKIECGMTMTVTHLNDGRVELVRGRGTTEHIDTLAEADQIKIPSVFRHLAAHHISMGYSAADVARNLRGCEDLEIRDMLQKSGGKWLTRQHIKNAGQAYLSRHPDSRRRGARFDEDDQIGDALDWLKKQESEDSKLIWSFRQIEAIWEGAREVYFKDANGQLATKRQKVMETSRGLVFAKRSRLELLNRYGALVLMDATHKTNSLEWKLFTLMIRTSEAAMIPAAHMLVPVENAAIVAAGLKQIRRWSPQWQPRWILTDDSAIEQLAVRQAFPGTSEGDARDVLHLLCRVHRQRSMDRRWSPNNKSAAVQELRRHLKAALYARRTRAGCLDSLRDARQYVREVDKGYFEREWFDTRSQWANYSRCLQSILQQINSTNAVESWHSVLKRNGAKASMAQWSLRGIIEHVANCAHDYDLRAERAADEFRGKKHVPQFKQWPGLALLPLPAQVLCVGQARECQRMLEVADEPPRELHDQIRCNCLFWRQYKLPCKHIFHQDSLWPGILNDKYWEAAAAMYGDEGFEIYEGLDNEYLNDLDEEEIKSSEMTLQFKSMVEQWQDAFYRFQERLQKLDPLKRRDAWDTWISYFHAIEGPLRRAEVQAHVNDMVGGAEEISSI